MQVASHFTRTILRGDSNQPELTCVGWQGVRQAAAERLGERREPERAYFGFASEAPPVLEYLTRMFLISSLEFSV